MSIKLDTTQTSLLHKSVEELITELSNDNKLSQVKKMACGYYNKETDEEFQIQVVVTRDESEFIEPFTIETYVNVSK